MLTQFEKELAMLRLIHTKKGFDINSSCVG